MEEKQYKNEEKTVKHYVST